MTTAVYRYPATQVRLGFVLDLTIEPNADVRMRIDDWAGWLMCCGENGFELQPGRAKLFLFAPAPDEGARTRDYSAAARAFERWHKREAKQVDRHEVPDKLVHCQGRVLRIGYRSDKWGKRGQSHDYDHDFCERDGLPPLLYTDAAKIDKSRGAVLVGGDMVITEGGIA
ncbi:MAG: hypothetical protein ACOYD1_12765 [Candidatus Nanopelagicales bacterium]